MVEMLGLETEMTWIAVEDVWLWVVLGGGIVVPDLLLAEDPEQNVYSCPGRPAGQTRTQGLGVCRVIVLYVCR